MAASSSIRLQEGGRGTHPLQEPKGEQLSRKIQVFQYCEETTYPTGTLAFKVQEAFNCRIFCPPAAPRVIVRLSSDGDISVYEKDQEVPSVEKPRKKHVSFAQEDSDSETVPDEPQTNPIERGKVTWYDQRFNSISSYGAPWASWGFPEKLDGNDYFLQGYYSTSLSFYNKKDGSCERSISFDNTSSVLKLENYLVIAENLPISRLQDVDPPVLNPTRDKSPAIAQVTILDEKGRIIKQFSVPSDKDYLNPTRFFALKNNMFMVHVVSKKMLYIRDKDRIRGELPYEGTIADVQQIGNKIVILGETGTVNVLEKGFSGYDRSTLYQSNGCNHVYRYTRRIFDIGEQKVGICTNLSDSVWGTGSYHIRVFDLSHPSQRSININQDTTHTLSVLAFMQMGTHFAVVDQKTIRFWEKDKCVSQINASDIEFDSFSDAIKIDQNRLLVVGRGKGDRPQVGKVTIGDAKNCYLTGTRFDDTTEAVAKLACPEKSMFLSSVGRASMSWPDCSDEFNLNKLNEKLQVSRVQKGDFNGQWSFATASTGSPRLGTITARVANQFSDRSTPMMRVRLNTQEEKTIATDSLSHFVHQQAEKLTALIKIQSLFRRHLVDLQVKKEKIHFLDYSLSEQGKRFIDSRTLRSTLSKSNTWGRSGVYLPGNLPIVLKSCHDILSASAKKRFKAMKQAREICQSHHYSHLTIPLARVYNEYIIESRLPVKGDHLFNIELYIDHAGKFTEAVSQFTKFLCQVTLKDITGNTRVTHTALSNVPIPRYDNVPLYLENNVGKIGLVDLEKFSPDPESSLTSHCYSACEQAIRLFPHHFETILAIPAQFNVTFSAAQRSLLEEERDETLAYFKKYYLDYLNFAKERGLTLEKPAAFPLSAVRKQEITSALTSQLPNLFDLGANPDQATSRFETVSPEILDLITAFLSKMIVGNIQKQNEPIASYPQLLSCRKVKVTKDNEHYKQLKKDILPKLTMLGRPNDFLAGLLIYSVVDQFFKGKEIAYKFETFPQFDEKEYCIFC